VSAGDKVERTKTSEYRLSLAAELPRLPSSQGSSANESHPTSLCLQSMQDVGAERIGVDDAVGHDLVVDDGLQRPALHVRDHPAIDLAAAFQQAEDGYLACDAATALALME